MKRRALLLSGGVSPALDHPCDTGDVRAYYRLLVNTYGYAEDDVRVCMRAGSPLSLDDDRLIATKPAKRKSVLPALRWLAELGAGDLAFMMVTDHGWPDGISLWGKNELLSPEDLASTLSPSPATKVIVLGQCYSGIFGVNPPGRTVICCACQAEGLSYPVPTHGGVKAPFSEFLYQLAGALAGRYPDGSPLSDDGDALPPPGQISIGEAFRYARKHDYWYAGMRRWTEEPRMFDPEGIADELTL